MRLGETLELMIENIDLFGCAIFLDGDTTKGRKDRVVFLVMKCKGYYKDG